MRRTAWGLTLAAALIAGAGCSDDDGPSDAVCDLLDQPLREVSGLPFVGDEQAVAELLERTAREAREESFSVTVFLVPGIPEPDVAAVRDLVDDVVESEVVLVTPAEALVEYEALFDESQSGFVDLDEESLPASVRFETDDLTVVDQVSDELDGSPSVFRVVDSRDFAQTAVRSLAIYAPGLLDDLQEVEDDADAAEAARTIADVAGADDPTAAEAQAIDAALVLADRAEACGLLD